MLRMIGGLEVGAHLLIGDSSGSFAQHGPLAQI